jgi:predicted peptidase
MKCVKKYNQGGKMKPQGLVLTNKRGETKVDPVTGQVVRARNTGELLSELDNRAKQMTNEQNKQAKKRQAKEKAAAWLDKYRSESGRLSQTFDGKNKSKVYGL